jgi:hypothetical protein
MTGSICTPLTDQSLVDLFECIYKSKLRIRIRPELSTSSHAFYFKYDVDLRKEKIRVVSSLAHLLDPIFVVLPSGVMTAAPQNSKYWNFLFDDLLEDSVKLAEDYLQGLSKQGLPVVEKVSTTTSVKENDVDAYLQQHRTWLKQASVVMKMKCFTLCDELGELFA